MSNIDDLSIKAIYVIIGFMVIVFYLKIRQDDDFGE